MTRVIYVGNFEPRHSTENHVKRALENNGVTVIPVQENSMESWLRLTSRSWLVEQEPTFVLWTRTQWGELWLDHQYRELQWKMLLMCDRLSIPTIGFHLDRWWGLEREAVVHNEPFFRVNTLITADGGHEDKWEHIGVDHYWMPPGVSRDECEPGMFRPEFASDIAFVGGWHQYGHTEWTHRPELIAFLDRTYGDRVKFWPPLGQPAIRNEDLRDLYASVKVLVGDSCLIPRRDGTPITRYCSDRIPETLGRGGLLIHPDVRGVTMDMPYHADTSIMEPSPWVGGEHLFTWDLGDWEMLENTINLALADPEGQSAKVRQAGREHTLTHHTYEQRMKGLVRLVDEWYGVK